MVSCEKHSCLIRPCTRYEPEARAIEDWNTRPSLPASAPASSAALREFWIAEYPSGAATAYYTEEDCRNWNDPSNCVHVREVGKP